MPESFSRDIFLTVSGTPHAKHLLSRRFLDGRGPKLVSKVSDLYDAVQQNSKNMTRERRPEPKVTTLSTKITILQHASGFRGFRGNGVSNCGADPP